MKRRITKGLDLERDLLLTGEDLRYMQKVRLEKTGKVDLGAYLDFLEQIGAFHFKKNRTKFYDCDFEL
jgi:hypothetical protein